MISVVIPVYNAEKYLRETVASVRAQTYADWELLLVDDGSKDSSPEMAAAFACEDSRISSLRQPNGGASVARNHGLREANPAFPYALCLDSDDLLLPDALQRLLALLERNPPASAACGFLTDIDAEGRPLPGPGRLEPLTRRRGVDGLRLVRRKPNAPVVFGDLCFHNHIITPGQVLIRKAALDAAGPFDTSLVYVEDYDLWWRLTMQAGPILVSPEPVLLYRHHSGSISRNPAARRRGAADFRWRLLTYPALSPAQRRTARLGYFYHCLAGLGFGLHYLRRGEVKHGLKHTALGLRDMGLYLRDLVRLRRQGRAEIRPAAHERA